MKTPNMKFCKRSYIQIPSIIFAFLFVWISTICAQALRPSLNANHPANREITNEMAELPLGEGTADNPYQIATLQNLLWISMDSARWDKHYVQNANIEAYDTAYWNNYNQNTGMYWDGWIPIGNSVTPFSGTYNGMGHTINNLSFNIQWSSWWGFSAGLFGETDGANISGVGLTNVNFNNVGQSGSLVGINNNSTISNCYSDGYLWSYHYVGGLVGINSDSTIINCHSSVNVWEGYTDINAGPPMLNVRGGLVGSNSGTIQNCYSTGSISGTSYIGGLIGENGGTISNSYSSGTVGGTENIGGLVGSNGGQLVNCYSSCSVSSGDYNYSGNYGMNIFIASANVGGLTGSNSGALTNCDSSGNVSSSGDFVGGLIGINYGTNLNSCYSTGNVTGTNYVGGLVGSNNLSSYSTAYLNNCYSSGSVSGTDKVGGLVGCMKRTQLSNSYSSGSTSGYSSVGGLTGWVEDSTIQNCFSYGNLSGTYTGGLISFSQNSQVSNSYWNTELSGVFNSAGGDGRTTTQMTFPYAANTFVGWDFIAIWAADTNFAINNGYPFLGYLSGELLSIPNAAINPLPAANAVLLNPPLQLSWQPEMNAVWSNYPQGYRFSLGTDNPPTNIVDNLDLGLISFYTPNPVLNHNAVYYWQVTPYNEFGNAVASQVWSFSVLSYDTPQITLLSPDRIDFGTVYLGSESNPQAIWLKNSGLSLLGITSLEFFQANHLFEIADFVTPCQIAPGDSISFDLVFIPMLNSTVTDTLYIHSEASNAPLIKIKLLGRGQYVPPDTVTGVSINVNGNDAVISWNAVTQTILGSPITPDYYVILYNETPYEDDNFYYYLTYTPDLSAAHNGVILFRGCMFYKVVAVKLFRDEQRAMLNEVSQGKVKITWGELKQELFSCAD